MKEIDVRIEGTTPLICNKFTDAAMMAASSGTRSSAVGDRGTPKEQAATKLYISEITKKPMIPQPNMFRAIIDAGTFHKNGKSKITTQSTSMIPACVDIEGSEIHLIHKEPWMVDSRAVRIPSTGGRIMAHRPIFNDWALEFTILVDTEMMTTKLLRQIVDDAGKRIGLGDFRPAKKGPFGKFVVTKWEEKD